MRYVLLDAGALPNYLSSFVLPPDFASSLFRYLSHSLCACIFFLVRFAIRSQVMTCHIPLKFNLSTSFSSVFYLRFFFVRFARPVSAFICLAYYCVLWNIDCGIPIDISATQCGSNSANYLNIKLERKKRARSERRG